MKDELAPEPVSSKWLCATADRALEKYMRVLLRLPYTSQHFPQWQ